MAAALSLDHAAKPRASVLELCQLDQVAGRIVEHDPARSAIFLDAPRQADLMRAQAFDGGIEIVDGEGDDRESGWNRIERRERPALEVDQNKKPAYGRFSDG